MTKTLNQFLIQERAQGRYWSVDITIAKNPLANNTMGREPDLILQWETPGNDFYCAFWSRADIPSEPEYIMDQCEKMAERYKDATQD